MTKRRPRGLRPDEKDLWHRYTEGVSAAPEPQMHKDPGERPTKPAPDIAPISTFKVGERAKTKSNVAVTKALGPTDAPPKMDKKTFGRLKKGQLKPQARIDLHGMTVADAHGALDEFIFRAQAGGLRLVLVITGKGDRRDVGLMPVERGVLRRQVPEWLRLPPLSSAVLDVAIAHRRHGGDGALYVYLRRTR
ncbi:MAG: Smr/MutS family protein [Pseudomonadota bacterium]